MDLNLNQHGFLACLVGLAAYFVAVVAFQASVPSEWLWACLGLGGASMWNPTKERYQELRQTEKYDRRRSPREDDQ